MNLIIMLGLRQSEKQLMIPVQCLQIKFRSCSFLMEISDIVKPL